MYQLDMAAFKMTRLSDVIGKGASEGILKNSNSEKDEIKLAELENLIEQMNQNWGVESEGNITQECSKLLKEKYEPLEVEVSKVKLKETNSNMNRKFIPEVKYTRDELLVVAKSAICRMPPPGWEEVVKQLPTVLIRHKDSTVPLENQIGEEHLKFVKRSSLHGGYDKLNESVATKGGINDVNKPSNDKEKVRHTNSNDAEILHAGNKSSFIDYLMFSKDNKNPSVQSIMKLKESKSPTKNEQNPSRLNSSQSLLCSICCELCKRGVSTPCCGAKACRYCAVKNLTDYVANVDRKCWSCSEGPVSTKDLVVDDNLREAIRELINTQTQGNKNCKTDVKCSTGGEVNGSESEEDVHAKFQFDF